VFQNSVHENIEHKKYEVTGGWRKLNNGELHKLSPSPDVIRMMKSSRMGWAGHVARIGAKRNVYMALVGKSEVTGLLGRPRGRLEDGIKIDLGEIGWSGMD
jgi:hypothetical protein